MTNSENLSRAYRLIEGGILGKHCVSSCYEEENLYEIWTNYVYVRVVKNNNGFRITGTFQDRIGPKFADYAGNNESEEFAYDLERGTNPHDELLAELFIAEAKRNHRFVL